MTIRNCIYIIYTYIYNLEVLIAEATRKRSLILQNMSPVSEVHWFACPLGDLRFSRMLKVLWLRGVQACWTLGQSCFAMGITWYWVKTVRELRKLCIANCHDMSRLRCLQDTCVSNVWSLSLPECLRCLQERIRDSGWRWMARYTRCMAKSVRSSRLR